MDINDRIYRTILNCRLNELRALRDTMYLEVNELINHHGGRDSHWSDSPEGQAVTSLIEHILATHNGLWEAVTSLQKAVTSLQSTLNKTTQETEE